MNQRIMVGVLCALALASHRNASGLEGGQVAPNCSLKLAASGQPIDVQGFRGKVVYVDFWASWCAPCAQAFPFMNDLERDFGSKGFQVLGVNVDKTPGDAMKFLAKHPAKFTVAFDTGGQCPREFDVQGMPSSYLVDRNGIIRYVHLGFRSGDAEHLRAMVEELLAKNSAERQP